MSDMSADMIRRLQADDARLRLTETKEVPGNIPGFTSFYAVGTFTPAFTGSGTAGSFTYSGQSGRYTRIGNLCFVRIYLEVSAISVAPTGDLNVTGLPFTSAAALGALAVGYLNSFNLSANCVQLTAYAESSATLIRLMEVFDNAATSRFPAASFQPSGIIIGGAYEV